MQSEASLMGQTDGADWQGRGVSTHEATWSVFSYKLPYIAGYWPPRLIQKWANARFI